MSRKIFISLRNENPADNKVILDGKELDVSGVGYLLVEITAGATRWIAAKQPLSEETIILKTPFEVMPKSGESK
jgi:hypothetical protein